MRKRIFLLLPALALAVLCACSARNDPMQKALDLRAALLQSGGCSFTAACSVNYDQTALQFSMRCRYGTDGHSELTLDSPETLAGISAYLNGEQAELRFRDTIAAMPLLDDGKLTPLKLAYLFGSSLSQDYISAAGAEQDAVRVTYLHGYDDEELTVDVYFDAAEFSPVAVEVSKNGKMLLAAEISAFALSSENDIK